MALKAETLRTHYPFKSHFLQSGDLKLHYLDEGSGDPVVMVHGNPSWSFMYRELAKLLRDRFRVIVPDHIGCGLSSKPDDSGYNYTLSQRVEDLERLLNGCGIRDGITLVMHDWGGVIGTSFAARHPERIKRIIVFNTAAFRMQEGMKLHWTIRFCRKSRLAASAIRGLNAFAVVASFVGCRMRPMSREIRRAYTAPYDSWANRIATLRFVQDIPLDAADPAYSFLLATEKGLEALAGKPMMICWGEKDFVFDTQFLSEWMRRFPEAEVHRFPDAGHYVLEDAFPEIGPLVEEFVGRPA